MAITFSTSATDKRMVQWWSGDTTTGWGGPNDGLDVFNSQIEGTSCIVIAARKSETLSITYTGTLTGVPAGSQLIFNTYTVLGAVLNSFSITVNDGSTGTATFNILPEFDGTAPSLNFFSFVAIAMDLEAGTLNPSVNNLSDISYDLDVQNVNIRATDNFFLDAAYVGDGVTLIGTTVGDKLFTEAQAQDISNDIHNGVLQAFEDVIFAQHDIDIDTTTGNSTNESLTFIETLNGANSYEMNGTGTAVFSGTNIQSTGTVTLVVNMSNMTSFTMTGGSIKNATTVTFGSGQTISRAVFDTITTFNTGSSTFTNNTLNTITTANISTASSGLRLNSVTTPNVTASLTDCIITESGRVDISAGSINLTRCTFTDTSATTSAVLASPSTLANITDSIFVRTTGTTNAVDLGNISTGTTVTWDGNTLTGYGTQLAGNNVSSTANGAIAVNFLSNVTLTISVVNGATVPTVEISGTGTVNIVAAVTVNINGLKDLSEVRVYTAGTTTELAGVESVSGGVGTGVNNGTVSGTTNDNTFSFSSSAGANLDIRIFNLGFDSTQFLNFTVSANGDNIEAVQVEDRVFSNP